MGGLAGNQTILPGQLDCTQSSCQYEDPVEVVRSDWASVLIYYTVIRCLIDVLRASSVMMFEVGVSNVRLGNIQFVFREQWWLLSSRWVVTMVYRNFSEPSGQ